MVISNRAIGRWFSISDSEPVTKFVVVSQEHRSTVHDGVYRSILIKILKVCI